jgi:hypothetical protein
MVHVAYLIGCRSARLATPPLWVRAAEALGIIAGT